MRKNRTATSNTLSQGAPACQSVQLREYPSLFLPIFSVAIPLEEKHP
jgi:hypothetical protein